MVMWEPWEVQGTQEQLENTELPVSLEHQPQ